MDSSSTNSAALHQFFSCPTLLIFCDASLPIHLIGPHALQFIRFPSLLHCDLLQRIIQSCSPRELSATIPLAAHAGAGTTVSALFNVGADSNARSATGKFAISLANSSGSVEVVQALLETSTVDRPFHDAAGKNRADLIALLLAKSGSGSWIEWAGVPDQEGCMPIHSAAATGNVDALRLCLSFEGDPSRTDVNGWTPLHWSVVAGHFDAAELLILSSDFDLRRAQQEVLPMVRTSSRNSQSPPPMNL